MKHETFILHSNIFFIACHWFCTFVFTILKIKKMYSIEVLWKALNSKGSGNNERFISKSLKGVKTLRVTLCFNYMAKEFLCSVQLLFICNNFSVLTMLGDGFTSFSLFLNELKQSQSWKDAIRQNNQEYLPGSKGSNE